jgi:small subunit ribosomal protein S1
MTEQGKANIPSWESPLGEEYWKALLQQGESAPDVPSPLERESPPGSETASAVPMPGLGAEVEEEVEVREGPAEAEEEEYLLLAPEDRWEREWQQLECRFEEGEVFTALVIGCNKGGLLVQLGEIRGFVPASQLQELPSQLGTEGLQEELEHRIGGELQIKLIELDRQRNRVICSERATAWDEAEIERRLAELCEGQVVKGCIRSLCDFGAFVDLGGIDGLIHISELSWQRVDHPSDVLQVGEEVETLVLNVDREQRRIGLSLKQMEPDPWSLVAERYQVGELVRVVITNVVDFGAFARVEEGVEGLIHISELAEGNFLHPRNVVQEGDVVLVRILNIDGDNHRLGLSLRQAWEPNLGPIPPSEQGFGYEVL